MIKTDKTFAAIEQGIEQTKAELKTEEVSVIHSISSGTAIVKGLAKAQMEELLEFPNGVWGMVQTLAKDAVGVVFLDSPDSLKAGDRVRRSGLMHIGRHKLPGGQIFLELFLRVID